MAKAVVASMIERTIQAVIRLELTFPGPIARLCGELPARGDLMR